MFQTIEYTELLPYKEGVVDHQPSETHQELRQIQKPQD